MSERVFCEECQKWIGKTHLAQHRRSRLHLHNGGYAKRDSDVKFEQFLANVHPERFSEYESQIYLKSRRQFLKAGAAWAS